MQETTMEKLINTSQIKVCCLQKCSQHVLNKKYMEKCRYRLWAKSFRERVQWFYDKLFESELMGPKRYFICDGGNKLCQNAFRDVYNINKNFYYKFLSKFTNGALAPGLSRVHQNERSKRNTEVIAWLEDYSIYHGDRMPDSMEFKLAYGTTKLSIYKSYQTEMKEKRMNVMSQSTFYKIWENEFRHVKIKQVA